MSRSTLIVSAVDTLLELDSDMWMMNATAFTCTEIEAIADLYRVTGNDETADAIIAAHAEGDDEGDDHYDDDHYDDGQTNADRMGTVTELPSTSQPTLDTDDGEL
jgi:hypothetical protein